MISIKSIIVFFIRLYNFLLKTFNLSNLMDKLFSRKQDIIYNHTHLVLNNIRCFEKNVNINIFFSTIRGNYTCKSIDVPNIYSFNDSKTLENLGLQKRHTYILGLPYTPNQIGLSKVELLLTNNLNGETKKHIFFGHDIISLQIVLSNGTRVD